MDTVVTLKFASSLDTLPCRGNLDEDTILLYADGLVENNKLLGLGLGCLLVERQTSVDLSGDTSGNDFEDFFAELNELYHWVSMCAISF